MPTVSALNTLQRIDANQSITAIPPLATGQIVYTTTYDANIVAQAGQTTLVKTMAIDTRNKVISQHNVKADTSVTYIATADGGDWWLG